VSRVSSPNEPKEVKVVAETIAEAWMEEGMAKGLTQGRTEEARTLLCRLLENKFGTLPEGLVQKINAATDLMRLHDAFQQGLTLDKLDDLGL
jgi:hypothetical protein